MWDGRPLTGEGEGGPEEGGRLVTERTQKDYFGDVSSMGREREIVSEDVGTGKVLLVLCCVPREEKRIDETVAIWYDCYGRGSGVIGGDERVSLETAAVGTDAI